MFVGVYALVWACGDHRDTYTLEPPKQVGAALVCAPGQYGPTRHFYEENYTQPTCFQWETGCPMLWFPFFKIEPCPYNDPLRLPYVEDENYLIQQITYLPNRIARVWALKSKH